MTLIRNLLGTNPVSGAVDPEAVSFDGTNDYLSRSSDLTGNSDGKTFTFSAWVYFTDVDERVYSVGTSGGGEGFVIRRSDSTKTLYVMSSGGTLQGTVVGAIRDFTWYHILISVNMASTSDRYIYLNDELQTVQYGWADYQNQTINFTEPYHTVMAAEYSAGSYGHTRGRAAHVFLDYTYRDLSTESNRRLFIDADGKPASGQSSLNPILYLPMTDASSAGTNEGTGGDFTVNGVLDTASRGPNQDNCSASEFDGTNDDLELPAGLGGTTESEITISFAYKLDVLDSSFRGLFGSDSSAVCIMIYYDNGIYIAFGNGSSGIYVEGTSTALNALFCNIGVNTHISISIDNTTQSNSRLFVNGVDHSSTFISEMGWGSQRDMDLTPIFVVGNQTSIETRRLKGAMGEFYLNNTYTDLSSDNPFWDADANRPKPVRQVISETGTTPRIALPLRGDDAGNNLGTGGDFTVNSGPYTGARGGSEFWARSANLGPGYLSSTASISNTTTLTMVFSFKTSYTGGISLFSNKVGSNYHANIGIRQATGSPAGTMFSFRDSSHNDCVQFSIPDSSLAGIGNWNIIMFSVDSSNSSLYKVYVNGVAPSLSDVVASGASMKFSSATTYFAYYYGVQDPYDIGSFYLDASYIDFSQESNRNLFVDQLGYPKDLTPAIEAGDIAEPRIYMKFDDTSALGTNSGTGGDFTVNGTVTAGADVDPNA
jgi:hypothetical protein